MVEYMYRGVSRRGEGMCGYLNNAVPHDLQVLCPASMARGLEFMID